MFFVGFGVKFLKIHFVILVKQIIFSIVYNENARYKKIFFFFLRED